MNTRLITPDGFPRADLDVAQSTSVLLLYQEVTNSCSVRTTRSRIIHLKNDYKSLMSVIEKHIHEHFARQMESTQTEESASNGAFVDLESTSSSRLPQPALTPPFAKVNTVVSGSPAETAGLKAGDEIRNFGYVNHTNHDGLKRVGECVQGNEGVSLLVIFGFFGP